MKKYFLLLFGVCATAIATLGVAYLAEVIQVESPSAGSADTKQTLRSLAYVDQVEVSQQDKNLSGVTSLVKEKIADSVNIYSPGGGDSAQLIDAQGTVLHELKDRRKSGRGGWGTVKPYRKGRFLVVAEGSDSPLFQIDWDSNVIWESKLDCHHDVCFDRDGNIYALCRKDVKAPEISTHNILDERVVVFSSHGKVIRELSFAKMFAKEPAIMKVIRDKNAQEFGDSGRVEWDVFHMNTLQVFRNQPGLAESGPFRTGNLLFCSRSLDLIGVVDMSTEKIAWHWGPEELEGPHVPSLLHNGNVLVFDNGSRRGRSRIVEVDPATGQIVATIGNDDRSAFFSSISGDVHRLPNGNTLIVESQKGRIFEVAPDGDKVWEFYSNPMFQNGMWMRRVVFRMSPILELDEFPELNAKRKPAAL